MQRACFKRKVKKMNKKQNNLWEEVGNRSLMCALELLEKDTATTAATVEAVQNLVHIAVEIDLLNLRWVEQNRCGAAALRGQTFQPITREN